ncbi:MAG TPA: ATP-binding cassette domain-containing protein [Candidatus Saccharimonadales bacterium]|nr:ATP-binding cassette domain-containing protein [Candidatus Saccharimonadales bacterium]
MSHRSEHVVEFEDVHYRVDTGRELLSELNLAIYPGETLMLLGRSGSGKTTCLNLINRMLVPHLGEVRVEGTATTRWDVIKLRRHIGYAIQDVGLFPHYTVEQNIAVIPKLEGWKRQKVALRVEEVLQIVGLPSREFARRYPDQLSGGQKQRVGLARALAADPPILLMDEPFGALDPITRAEIQREFKSLQRKLAKTIVFVTHDVGEALLLSSRIALMESGKLHGVYAPQEFVNSSDTHVKPYIDAFRISQQILQP